MAIKGKDSVNRMFRDKLKGYRKGVRSVAREVGEEIEFLAKMFAPPMIDGLINGKIISNQNGYGYAILVDEMPGEGLAKNMPVYLEFGTGVYAAAYVPTLPDEWQKAARKYFINGKGTTQAHSFIYPAWNSRGKTFIDRVREVLRK